MRFTRPELQKKKKNVQLSGSQSAAVCTGTPCTANRTSGYNILHIHAIATRTRAWYMCKRRAYVHKPFGLGRSPRTPITRPLCRCQSSTPPVHCITYVSRPKLSARKNNQISGLFFFDFPLPLRLFLFARYRFRTIVFWANTVTKFRFWFSSPSFSTIAYLTHRYYL